MSEKTSASDQSPLSPPEPLDDIHHLAIEARDLPAMVDWYTSHFRCRVEYRDDTWALLAFGNIKLALVNPDQHPSHIGIASPGAASYGPLITHRDATRSVYIHDPHGNLVEIMDPESL